MRHGRVRNVGSCLPWAVFQQKTLGFGEAHDRAREDNDQDSIAIQYAARLVAGPLDDDFANRVGIIRKLLRWAAAITLTAMALCSSSQQLACRSAIGFARLV